MSLLWRERFWKLTINGHLLKTLVVEKDTVKEEDGMVLMILKAGTPPHKIDNAVCNLEIFWVIDNRAGYGAVSPDGKKIKLDNGGVMDWMDEEEYRNINDKDPVDDIPNHYHPKPDQLGTILWISGSTGMGKTTTAKMLQEDEGFVYYEGDCFLFGLNPYVGAAPNGSTQFGTKALSGIPKERIDVCRATLTQGYSKLMKGEQVEVRIWEDFYDMLCQDVLRERAKVGGKWVVAQAVYTRAARDIIRKKIGADLRLVVLESEEPNLQIERLAGRAIGKESITEETLENYKEKVKRFLGNHETVEDDEPNTFKLLVTKDKNPEEVSKIVLGKFE